jgi:hypothetical protein
MTIIPSSTCVVPLFASKWVSLISSCYRTPPPTREKTQAVSAALAK